MANKGKERGTFSYLYEWARPYRSRYLLSVLFAVCEVGFGIVPFVCLGKITELLVAGEFAFTFGTYGMWLLIAALCWVGHYACHMVSTTISHKATFTVISDVRTDACDKLARMSLGDVLSRPSGEIKNTILERIDSIETTLAHIVPEVSSKLLAPIALFVYIMTIDWRVGLISLITIPVGLLMYMCMMIGYKKKFERYVRAGKNLNSVAVEYINGIEVIKAFGKAQSSYDKFVVAAKEGASCYVEWMRRCNIYFCLAMSIFPATMIAVLPIGGLLFRAGTLDAGTFIQVILFSVGLIAPLITVMSYGDDLAKLSTIIGEVTSLLTLEDMKRPDTSASQPQSKDIKLKDVTFGYHEKEVLHGINLEIREGTVNALVGPSGSGKSTIARLVASLWDVSGGSITLGGVDIRKLTQEDYHRYIAYVSQDNFLFDTTVMENIRMGKQNATDAEVMEAAKACGCHAFILSLENGYDTVVGGAGGHLSGGERQRIAIARAMLKNAPIIILDEATAFTDPENEAMIQSAVAKLTKGKTLIVIAHRLSTITNSDQIFVVEDGKIRTSGTHEELLAQDELYAQMWRSHISVRDTVEGGAQE